jgi:hypothetical protein
VARDNIAIRARELSTLVARVKAEAAAFAINSKRVERDLASQH